MIENTLLARLSGQEVLVAPHQRDWFQSCLSAVLASPHAEAMLQPALYTNDDGYWPSADSWEASYKPYVVKGGVLQVPIFGVLLNRFGFQYGRYATGYTYIERAVSRGLADPDVRGIAFICDTPGGEVAGNFELVDKLYSWRGQKPMRAFSAESAYSAGYSIASAADKIVMTRTSGVGSIGVVTAHVSYEKAMEKMGVKVTFIFAGKHKVDGNPYEDLGDDAKARIQARIDNLYSIFAGTVARNRNMPEEDVRSTEALTFMADEAIELGLADSMGVFDETLEAFRVDCETGEDEMAEQGNVTGKKPEAGGEEAIATARAEGKAEGKAEGLKEGATAERARINAILASDAGKERPKAAMSAALKTDMSVEAATAFLADLPAEQAQAEATKPAAEAQTAPEFATAMNQSEQPNVGAEGGVGGEGANAPKSNPLVAAWRTATGIKA